MNRDEAIQKAIEIITGDREQEYGEPENSFETIAEFWEAYLTAREGAPIRDWDVAVMMALLKIARIANGKFKEDSYVDAIGYLAIGAELASEEV